MNRGLYTSATGMVACQQWMDVVANNLANASSTGFKRDEIAFKESYLQKMMTDGGLGGEIGSLQSGPVSLGTFTVFEKGAIQMTSNPLDLAIDSEEGMFAVQTTNGTRYTRSGAFTLSDDGTIVTQGGNPVLDKSGRTIQARGGKITIEPDGQVSDSKGVMGQIALYTGEFRKEGNAFYTVKDQAVLQDNPRMISGATESSNVNTVQTMIEMIQVQRLYEMAQKSVQQHDEASKSLIEGYSRG